MITSDAEILVFVLARGGSKGIPGKNLRQLFGKPLVAWSLNYALAHGYQPTLSTDSDEIADVARSLGLKVPRLRDSHLARDDASSVSALLDAAAWLAPRKARADSILVLLEPTSPIRPFSLLPHALSLLHHPEIDSVVSVVKATDSHCSNQFGSVLSGGYVTVSQVPDGLSRRRQDLSDSFFPDGSMYVTKHSSLTERQTFYHERTALVEVTGPEHIDIDREEDMALAEIAIRGLEAALSEGLEAPGIDIAEYRWMFDASEANN